MKNCVAISDSSQPAIFTTTPNHSRQVSSDIRPSLSVLRLSNNELFCGLPFVMEGPARDQIDGKNREDVDILKGNVLRVISLSNHTLIISIAADGLPTWFCG